MDDKRAKTLQALSEFIQEQRALLSRTQSDIGRLNELRSRIISEPVQVANNLAEELNSSTFRFSDQVDCQAEIPKNINWSVYEKFDPAPLQALRPRQQQQPCITSSSLQEFVKQSRTTILDPVFARLDLSFDPQPEPEEAPQPDPAVLKKNREQEKIRELKKRKIISSGLTVTNNGHRVRGPGGVFVRRDDADENMDVDISLDDDSKHAEPSFPPCVDVDVSMSTTSNSPPPPPPPTSVSRPAKGKPPRRASTALAPPPMVLTKSPRVRRPSVKATNDAKPKGPTIIIPALSSARRQIKSIDCNAKSTSPPPPILPIPPSISEPQSPSASPEPFSEDENDENGAPISVPASTLGKRTREDKSETYKKAWSSSEQHLLERLLEQIPAGQKNRWKKISDAMDGRRNPRQVASRVQKYFEKLKRHGVSVDD
ncbi:hypothetical protein VNI00_004296 [Paramarasmius palmivorus]|uniref:Myb-like domain-containing protein n=1 Tax=Paramarasmius palmivorus TaxID=297713 RepID=A0AAW0DQ50_9AGAR